CGCVWVAAWHLTIVCFFFSSRRRHTRLVSDWSSDVCSSDLEPRRVARALAVEAAHVATVGSKARKRAERLLQAADELAQRLEDRSEERRVGKEGRCRGGAED